MPFHFPQLPTPAFLGILNITPNSFSDGNQFLAPQAAIDHAHQLLKDGAHILDLGAEASSFFRPNVTPVDADEQLHRLLPVVHELAKIKSAILSIDTRSAKVADQCLHAGAHIINDISAAEHDPDMLSTVARHHAALILMHITPTYPATPKENDPDILATVQTYLAQRLAAAQDANIRHTQLALDPGLGFGKTPADNWTLALQSQEIQATLRTPLLLGASRKRFLETTPPENLIPKTTWQNLLARSSRFSVSSPPHPRDPATFALTHLAIQNGIQLHRLHNPARLQQSTQ